MLKYLLTAFLLLSSSGASEKMYSSKIIQNIIEVLNGKNHALWLNEDNRLSQKMINSSDFKKASSCKDASVLVITSDKEIPRQCESKPMLVLKYDLLEKHSNAVSAFFWQKGRPNIVFIKKRLQYFSISLPPTYEKYVEEQIW